MKPTLSLVTVVWALLALFMLRVLGQVIVVLFAPPWLPPMSEWYSGLLPYPLLLPAQVLIIALMVWICLSLSRGRGWWAQPKPRLGRGLLVFGVLYAAAMAVRYVVRMWLVPEARWFGGTIPIIFHFVLATFVLVVAHHHRSAPARAP